MDLMPSRACRKEKSGRETNVFRLIPSANSAVMPEKLMICMEGSPMDVPISVNTVATAYPARIPMMNGIRRSVLFPYVLVSMVVIRAVRPHRTAHWVASPVTELICRSPMAFPARERPIIATVGPMTTGGMMRLIHSTPTKRMMKERIT